MTPPALTIRDARPDDAAACLAIYRPYVTDTVITFETQVPAESELAARIADAQRLHAFLVGESGGRIVGYTYGHAFNSRAAYRWSCESSIYLDAGARGNGFGRALYAALLARLTERGYRRVFAGIAQPNAASAALHRGLGFEQVALYRRVGWKFDGWHDVAWQQLDLVPSDREIDPPAEIS